MTGIDVEGRWIVTVDDSIGGIPAVALDVGFAPIAVVPKGIADFRIQTLRSPPLALDRSLVRAFVSLSLRERFSSKLA
jgi:hypothetical protein